MNAKYAEGKIRGFNLAKKSLTRVGVPHKNKTLWINPISPANSMYMNKYGRYLNDRYTLLYTVMNEDKSKRVINANLKGIKYAPEGLLYLTTDGKTICVRFYNKLIEEMLLGFESMVDDKVLSLLISSAYIYSSPYIHRSNDGVRKYTYPLMILTNDTKLDVIDYSGLEVIYGYVGEAKNEAIREAESCDDIKELRGLGEDLIHNIKKSKIKFADASVILSMVANHNYILNHKTLTPEEDQILTLIASEYIADIRRSPYLISDMFKYIVKYREVVKKYSI